MKPYRFLTTWLLDAPRERVWDVLYDAQGWPRWWRGVERMDVDGDVWHSSWRSVLPYTLHFDFTIVHEQRPVVLRGNASGELAGSGTWRLYESDLGTASTWEWDVVTTAAWMNAFGPLARPVFAWNHHRIMRRGAEGLARELGCRLLGAS